MNESAESTQSGMSNGHSIHNEPDALARTRKEELFCSHMRQNLQQEENLSGQSLQGFGPRPGQSSYPPKNCGFPCPPQQNQQRPCVPPAQLEQQHPCSPPAQPEQQRPCAPRPNQECAPCPEPKPETPLPARHAVAYQAALPYPLVKVEGKNQRYAAAMLDNMGGPVSEISAVTGYFYNCLASSAYKEISETFHHISIVEMHHLQIFGELAMKLGENPRLWSHRGRGGQYIYWSPAYLKYPPFPLGNPEPKEICSPPAPGPAPARSDSALKILLSQSIEAEQAALNKYMQQTTWIKDVNICDNLRRIAADEQMHIDILTRLYHKYCS